MPREFPSETIPAGDAFNESDHPRANNGQFGSGGGGYTTASLSKTNPGMDPLRAKAIAGGAPMNPREVAQRKHHEQYPSGGLTLRKMVEMRKAAEAKSAKK